MKLLQETTVWEDRTPNHAYFLEGDRCVGYIKAGTDTPVMFAKPMRFDKRRRTFTEVEGLTIGKTGAILSRQ